MTAIPALSRPRRLLFLVSSMHGGGAERVAATLANAWSRRGDEVTLVCCYSGRGRCDQDLAQGEQFGHRPQPRRTPHPVGQPQQPHARRQVLIAASTT